MKKIILLLVSIFCTFLITIIFKHPPTRANKIGITQNELSQNTDSLWVDLLKDVKQIKQEKINTENALKKLCVENKNLLTVNKNLKKELVKKNTIIKPKDTLLTIIKDSLINNSNSTIKNKKRNIFQKIFNKN